MALRSSWAGVKKTIFLLDHAPSHAAGTTTRFLESRGLPNDILPVLVSKITIFKPYGKHTVHNNIICMLMEALFINRYYLWMTVNEPFLPNFTAWKRTVSENNELFGMLRRRGGHNNK